MVRGVLLLVNFISANPGFVAWMLGGLVTTVVGLLVGYYGFIGHRISVLEATDRELATRVTHSEQMLEAYREHVGAGDRELKSVADALKAHIDREESEVWGNISKLVEKIHEIQVENVAAHASITERIVKMETRLVNGDHSKGGRR